MPPVDHCASDVAADDRRDTSRRDGRSRRRGTLRGHCDRPLRRDLGAVLRADGRRELRRKRVNAVVVDAGGGVQGRRDFRDACPRDATGVAANASAVDLVVAVGESVIKCWHSSKRDK